MKFKCNNCKSDLTKNLENKTVDLCEEDGKDLIPTGITLQSDDWGNNQWLINSKENTGMKVTSDPKKLNGCCDLDGEDGPNLLCKNCDNEVAIAKYDCWMPKYIILINEGVTVVT